MTNVQAYQGRDPHDATRLAVHRNLHAAAWSLLAVDGKHAGSVVGHAKHLVLDLPVFKVSEAGRQRAIRDGQRNVHAFVVGMLADLQATEVPDGYERVTYNPFRYGYFHFADGMPDPVTTGTRAVFTADGHVFVA